MKHIEEHILERYVVREQLDPVTRAEIEAHLSQCYGCRETVGKMRAFYSALDARLNQSSADAPVTADAVERIQQHITAGDPLGVHLYEQFPATRWSRVVHLTRRHPIVVAGSAISIVGFAVLFLSLIMQPRNDNEPDHLYLDEQNNLILIRNKEYETVRKYPFRNLAAVGSRFGFGSRPFILTDIDGDGKKEFLVSSPRTDDDRGSPVLRVFDHDHHLKFEYVPKESLVFRGRKYDETFFTSAVDVVRDRATGKVAIAVTATNGRSPSILTILNEKGKELGQYYHFGNINLMFKDALSNGGEYLFLTGSCDIDEVSKNKYQSYGVVAVINPFLLTGKAESSHTPGFGYGYTPGESYYFKFPYSDIDYAMRDFRAGAIIANQSDNAIIIRSNNGTDGLQWEFDYTFDRNLVVKYVKANDGTFQTHESLKKDKKLHGNIDSIYLNDLKNRIVYWNGRSWEKTPYRIVFDGSE